MRLLPERRLVYLLLLVAAAALTGWWLYGKDGDERRARAPVVDEYDYSLSGFEVVEMDPLGIPEHTLRAESLYHYPDNGHSTMTRPRMDIFEQRRRAWEISAQDGVIYEADRSVFLQGEVQVEFVGETETESFNIYTERLHVWPEEGRAETEALVTIVGENGITTSMGMRAELDVRRIHLLSDVRGSYAP